MKKLFVCGMVVAGVMFAAGCGGGGGTSSTPLSKPEFVTKADAICTQGNQAINTAAQAAFGHSQPSSAQIQQFAQDTLIPQTQDNLDAIRALPAPSGDEDQVNALLDAAQQGLDKIKGAPSLVTQGSNAGGAFTQANKLATAYGLRVCGGG